MFEVLLSREAENIYLRADSKTTRLLDKCFTALEKSPLAGANIKRLKGTLEGSYRYRIGGIRIIYNVEIKEQKVFVEAIGSRGDVY